MHTRRSILASLGIAAIAGCTGPGGSSGPSDTGSGDAARGDPADNATGSAHNGSEPTGDAEEDAEPTDGPTAEASRPDPRGPVRAGHDEVPSIRTVEDDENVTLTESGAVRFVAAWRHTNHEEVEANEAPPEREPVYETTEWEGWAEMQARHAGASEAADVAAQHLGVEGLSAGSSSTIVDDGSAAVVETTTTLDREGEVVSTHDVAFEDLVASTPRTVQVAYVLEDREYETDVPIYVRHTVAQYD